MYWLYISWREILLILQRYIRLCCILPTCVGAGNEMSPCIFLYFCNLNHEHNFEKMILNCFGNSFLPLHLKIQHKSFRKRIQVRKLIWERSDELVRVRPITSQLKVAIELPIEGNIDRELGNLAFNDSY